MIFFSTFLYKFYPCLQSWSIYSSMAHTTIWHTVISLWILFISLLCAFPPTHVPFPYPKGCLYSFFMLLVSLLFFSCLSSWWVGWFCTSHSLGKKNFPSDSFTEPNLTHLICTQTEIQSWVKAAVENLFLNNFCDKGLRLASTQGVTSPTRVPVATGLLWPWGL